MAKEKPKTDDPETLVLDYLREKNRPYSAIDISANLHGVISKTIVTRACTALVDKGQIMQKTYGKQVVYVVKQNDGPISTEEIAKMDEEIEKLKVTSADLKGVLSGLTNEYSSLSASLTTSDALAKISFVQKQNEILEQRLGMERVSVPIEERKRIENELQRVQQTLKERKRIAIDMLMCICENGPKKEDLVEQLGLEMD